MDDSPDQAKAWFDAVAEAYGRGRPLALLFDYDGTLTPIVRHPSLARLAPATRRVLRRLADLPDTRVAVISGRALGEVRNVVGLDGVYYAGSGGLEIDLLGEEDRYPDTDAFGTVLDELQDQLSETLIRYPGTWLERKPGAVAIHYRGLLPLAATCFRFDLASLLSAVPELRFRVVSEAIEVTPAGGWDKGTAVTTVLAHTKDDLGSWPLALYFGDAANDAEGMLATSRAQGLSIGIGPDAPEIADQRFDTPSELTRFLGTLSDRLRAARGLPAGAADSYPDSTARPQGLGSLDPHGPHPCTAGLLLLDADERFGSELAKQMAKLGWQVWLAQSFEAASRVMADRGKAVDVVLVDLQLPGLSGARALAKLGHDHPNLVRCFTSESIDTYVATAFQRMSKLPLFVKPFRAKDLDASLRDLMARSPCHLAGEHATLS